MAPSTAEFKASDGTTNITKKVRAAFFDKGLSAVVGGVRPAAPDLMSAAEIDQMLNDSADWRLAIEVGDKKDVEVLTRRELASTWAAPNATGTVAVVLEPIAPSDKMLLDAAPKLYAPDASLDRLKETLALPVAQAGLVATGAGLFGLLALGDKITNTDAMQAAIIFAALSIGVSLVSRYSLSEVKVKPARLDLLEKLHDQSIREPLLRARLGMLLLLIAVVLAIKATWPSDEPKAAEATISAPSLDETRAGVTATLTVKWANLSEPVERVRTTVTQDGTIVLTRVTGVEESDEIDDELQVEVAKTATVEVTTRGLDAEGVEVASGASERFDVSDLLATQERD